MLLKMVTKGIDNAIRTTMLAPISRSDRVRPLLPMRTLTVLAVVVAVAGLPERVGHAQTSETALKNRAERRLAEKGITVDSESLAVAVHDKDFGIAVAAIRMARYVPTTSSLTIALLTVTNEPEATVALAAVESLSAMGNREWVPTALGRVHAEPHLIDRFQFAVFLAKVGRGDGWPAVREMLVRDRYGGLEAIGVAGRFDGLPNATGERVDVRSELVQLQERVDPGVRWYVDLEIRKLSERKR